ncbi:MAG: trans-2-enoyl-CoA reductase family protein [Verrucomicrobiaceae bacterium]|nr:trans-2-enoyl-CoA reductase family protein [Verrucomicrobiaceae bacterium]
MIIEPRVKGFLCITAHPDGCAKNIEEQIDYVKSLGAIKNGCKSALIIGSSTGYGLASRICAAFGCKASTVGVFFERAGDVARERPGSAGWYNTQAFTKKAQEEGLYVANINGDAFSDEIKQQAIDAIKQSPLGKVDLIIYSLASPRRTDPQTGQVYRSVLKTIGQERVDKSLDTDKGTVINVTVPSANEKEVSDTVKTMGGEDWELWIKALEKAGVIADGCTSVAYSYIGPKLTYPIYRDGTIGEAKKDLEATAERIDNTLKLYRGKAFVSINKALVTQASSAIPVVPLYVSILYKVMKQKGIHEDCIMQIARLFSQQMYNDNCIEFDDEGRARIDDLELRDDVQNEVFGIWEKITTENLNDLTDFAGYKAEFLKLFGFGVDGVDYSKDCQI